MARRKMKNAATVAQQQPVPSTIHQHSHGNNWAGIILVGFSCFLLLLPVLWWIGVFLLDRAGARRPQEALATGVIWFAIGLPTLALVSWLIGKAAGAILDRTFMYLENMQELKNKGAYYQAMTVQQALPAQGRLNDEDAMFAALLKDTMHEAYRHLAQHGPYGGNEPRPWSRGPALQRKLVAFGNRKPTWAMASNVRRWLMEKRAIKEDQVNVDKYPRFSDFEALVNDKFYMPVQVRAMGLSSTDEDRGYVHI
jgi:hypothetical protein